MNLQSIEIYLRENEPPYPADIEREIRSTLKKLLGPRSPAGDKVRMRAHNAFQLVSGITPRAFRAGPLGNDRDTDRLMAAHRSMIRIAKNRIVRELEASQTGVMRYTTDRPVIFEAAQGLLQEGRLHKLAGGVEHVRKARIDPATGKRREREFVSVCLMPAGVKTSAPHIVAEPSEGAVI